MNKESPLDLFDKRALLFLPASNPRAIARARASDADLVILDLEDAVKPDDKEAAREAAVAAVAEQWPMPVAIRINGVASLWFDADVAAVAKSAAAMVVTPRTQGVDGVARVAAQTGKPVLAMIETAAGVLAAPGIARVAQALIAGTNDLAADLRLPSGAGRQQMQMALQTVVLAARAAGVAAFDGVFNRLDDPDELAAECADSRRLGFDGKSLIHPDQIAACQAAFAPTPEEIARARRLIEAAGGGAERFEGAMVETMHVAAARRLLARSPH
ncbi:MAG: CoA ester lyase [Sphingomonas sp.]|uniref:HpcH/HpaI aldolase/citrate lyase family protein n=1 Tax=Sphingomonas sp. TaxID=28214 RepID=UPI0017C24CDC|nr:CoA ester lyase [Sphingomonas sp.]MBA3666114.1 CoA ester lyase [Sphingomonas sp.]